MKSRLKNKRIDNAEDTAPMRKKRGVSPKPVIEFPEPISTEWSDPPGFHEALVLHMDRHGDTIWHLHRAVRRPDEQFDRTTIREWRAGRKAPRSALSFTILERIERRYRLPAGYGRFLPQDKAALAARILNQVWEAA